MITKFFINQDNCFEIVRIFLSMHSVKVTNPSLDESLSEHPDYPSLLSISDTLIKYGLENIALKITKEDLIDYPIPLIAQIMDEGDRYFTIIRQITEENIEYLNPRDSKWMQLSLNDFNKIWPSKTVLIANVKEKNGEDNYKEKQLVYYQDVFKKIVLFCFIPVVSLISVIWQYIHYDTSYTIILFTLTMIVGYMLGIFLKWYDIDKLNPIAQQVCNGSKKINCGAILNSKASKIFGVSWSSIGFTFFCGGLISCIIVGLVEPEVKLFFSVLSVSTIPFSVFSIVYQWKYEKQWCILCLSVVVALILQFLIVINGEWYNHETLSISTNMILQLLFSYAIPSIFISLIFPALRIKKEGKDTKMNLQRIKHNYEFFESVLSKQKYISESLDGLGIILGKNDAKHKIVKICNPYCNPCAKAHEVINDLLKEDLDLQVQIIFMVYDKNGDNRTLPAKHMLTIASEKEEAYVHEALDSWYSSKEKNYLNFAENYPTKKNMDEMSLHITKMNEWCEKMSVSFTPTIFLNGHQLPAIYNLAEIKYFLRD